MAELLDIFLLLNSDHSGRVLFWLLIECVETALMTFSIRSIFR